MDILMRYSTIVALAILFLMGSPAPAHAEIEWTEKGKLTLEAAPLDVVTTPDGKWCIVLSRGQLAVYTIPDYKAAARFPVDASFDRMRFSDSEEQIILSSSTGTTIRFVQLDEVYSFSLKGRPAIGPEKAQATVVVFSDYQ